MEKQKIHHRKSIRLAGYDYSKPGAYFITIKTNRDDKIFGRLWNGKMHLNEFGKIIHNEWMESAKIRREIILDEFVILPDHFHGIVWIIETDNQSICADGQFENGPFVGANGRSPLRCIQSPDTKPNPFRMRPKSLSSLAAGFKSATTTQINKIKNQHGISVWQRNFHDRIVRDDAELWAKRRYIANNPMNHWIGRTGERPFAHDLS